MCLFRRERCNGLSFFFFEVSFCGFRSGSFAISGWSLVLVLHSFLSFASLPICLSPAREMSDLSCTGVVVSCLVGCTGHISVAMSW